MSCLVAFHYRSYGTFCIYSKRLHNFHGSFTHYRNYRAEILSYFLFLGLFAQPLWLFVSEFGTSVVPNSILLVLGAIALKTGRADL